MENEKTLAIFNVDERGISIESFMADREPRGQLMIAAEYIVAAVILNDNHKDFPVPWSGYLLACHAIELSLKAALQLAGVSPQELKKNPLRHDLSRLLERCLSMPEFQLEAKHVTVIENIAPPMSEFTFRYGLREAGSDNKSVKTFLPPLILVIAAANEVRATSWRLFNIWPDRYSKSISRPDV